MPVLLQTVNTAVAAGIAVAYSCVYHGDDKGHTRPGPLVLDFVSAHNEYVAPFLLLILNW